ncbi:MAG: hypothetical protein HQL96_05355 [Magnetococcales bacterium]|nr:hypothetical protein [Magnetococcales bacterium]
MNAGRWQRQTVRVQPPDGIELLLNISQNSCNLDVVLLNLGAGGCSVVLPHDEALPEIGVPAALTLHWCIDQRIFVQGVLLRIHHHPDTLVTGHLRFATDDPQALQAITALVFRLERVHLRAKSNWAHPEQEFMNPKPPARGYVRQSICRRC